MSQWHLVHLYGPVVWHWVHQIFGPLWGQNVTVCLDIPEGITFLFWKVDNMSQNVSIILLRNMYVSWKFANFVFPLLCAYIYIWILLFSKVGIDIDPNVGDIRHPTSTSVIPILEINMSDWKLSVGYRKCSDIDIRVHSESDSYKNSLDLNRIRTHTPHFQRRVLYDSAMTPFFKKLQISIEYRLSFKSGPILW